MILVDTSIWIDHLRAADAELARLLRLEQVVMHPHVPAKSRLATCVIGNAGG